jgi:hypothetical protein
MGGKGEDRLPGVGRRHKFSTLLAGTYILFSIRNLGSQCISLANVNGVCYSENRKVEAMKQSRK